MHDPAPRFLYDRGALSYTAKEKLMPTATTRRAALGLLIGAPALAGLVAMIPAARPSRPSRRQTGAEMIARTRALATIAALDVPDADRREALTHLMTVYYGIEDTYGPVFAMVAF